MRYSGYPAYGGYVDPAQQALMDRADAMQQASLTPQIDPHGAFGMGNGMAMLAQALAANRLRQRALKMAQSPMGMTQLPATIGGNG